jgi:hypothetical protein
MSELEKAPPTKAGHEGINDVDFGAVIKFGASLAALGVVTAVLIMWLLGVFERADATDQAPAAPLAAEQSHLPPEPRLQAAPGTRTEAASPQIELQGIRQKEGEQLGSYGWVNEKAGEVRIPIDQAKQMLLQRTGSAPDASTKKPEGPGIELPTYASAGRQVAKRVQ